MPVIMMPALINNEIKEMCKLAITDVIKKLSEKYCFEQEEAEEFLNIKEMKLENKNTQGSLKKAEKKEEKKAEKKVEKKEEKKEEKKLEKKQEKKKPKSGYILYCAEKRGEVKEELLEELEEGEKLQPKEVLKALAAKWKGEDQEVRDHWNDVAKALAATTDEDSD